MKSFNTFSALAIAVSLIAGVTGCKKTPKNPTHIPRPGETVVGSDPNATSRLAGPTTGPKTGATPTNPNTPPGGGLPGDGTTSGVNLPGTNTNPDGSTTTSTPLTQEQKDKIGERPNLENTTDDAETLKSETVYFAYDRATVPASEMPKVQRVAAYLKNNPGVALRVEGNCDERGTEEYNRSLGERRALAIREAVVNSGIAPEQVTTVSFGEDKPVELGHDEAAWAKNRRGDFVLLRARTNIQ